MPGKRTHSLWISFQNAPLFGINLCGYGSDVDAVRRELEAVESDLKKQPRDSVLADLDVTGTELLPEVMDFFQAHSGQETDPIRKLAILGIPEWKRWWLRVTKKVTWPRHARFFSEQEQAKAWLILEKM